jgi:uncharacterized 2Fe-2S/4Fe-4S cluster protein (DUF4445 family)
MKIKIENSSIILDAMAGETILLACKRNGLFISAPCGGQKKCGKCKVRLLEGQTSDTPDENGKVRTCSAFPVSDITIAFDDNSIFTKNEKFNSEQKTVVRAGVALDIGTTTISAQLIDLENFSVVETFSALNDQRVFGADVMSRIYNAKKNGTEELFSLINRQTERILNNFKERFNISKIEKLSVSANTVMLHLFLNIDPSGMGEAPFTPVFLDEKIIKGEELSLSVETVYILPSISSFIGADITSGLASLDIMNREEPSLFIDLGTNAEMALVNRGNIFCCSAAAGPAFEGAENSIHGSILIDAISEMITNRAIDETGILKEKVFTTADGISVTPLDIREFMLAKSAVISGINILCKKENLSVSDIKNVYIGGGFGLRLNQRNAITAGLFPKEFLNKISVCGNLSLKGAVNYLSDKNFSEKCKKLIDKCTVIDLAGDPLFADEFVSNMLFIF